MLNTYHSPVLLPESIAALAIKPSGVYIDCTFGGGGHSRAILEHLNENGRLIAFDQDKDASQNSLHDPRFLLIEANFKHLKRFLKLHNIYQVDGILADLGVSSHQFDVLERGFLFRENSPLDMRMDQNAPITAATWLQTATESEIADVLFQFGEIRNSRKVAHALFISNLNNAIENSTQLCGVLRQFVPKGERESKFFARVFQAIRIFINQELEALETMLTQAESVISPNGRLVVISYHSLEDRLVKHFLRAGNFNDKQEKDFFGIIKRPFKPLSAKAIVPTPEEINQNPRARSAKMRIGERLP